MNINFMSEVVPYIHYQKERWDGLGKPEGLGGFSIPFGSRIIAVADAYCALTEDRPHRAALSSTEALENFEIRKCREMGSQCYKCACKDEIIVLFIKSVGKNTGSRH